MAKKKVTRDIIREIVKHNKQEWHDQEWHDFHNSEHFMAIDYAIDEAKKANPDKHTDDLIQEIREEALNFEKAVQ